MISTPSLPPETIWLAPSNSDGRSTRANIPIALVDQRDLRGSGGNWIALDLRGLYVAAYLVAVGFVTALVLLHLNVTLAGP